ncbi:hypothetical protein, partial [Burkholderia sp. TSV86]|uniref:hypothetical protein n=1 Tax=Burkholderia sp. TSV86 TaxID=1385594 RepID=UPI000A81AA9C
MALPGTWPAMRLRSERSELALLLFFHRLIAFCAASALFAPSYMASHDYLKKILTARVYDVARETELERARNLSARLGND